MKDYIGHNWTYEPIHVGDGHFKIAIYDEKHIFIKYLEGEKHAESTHHKKHVNQN